MALRPTWSVQRLSSTVPQARTQSRSSTLGPITLGRKQTGAPSAGNPHAGCDEAGTGNRLTDRLVRHSQRKRRVVSRRRASVMLYEKMRGLCQEDAAAPRSRLVGGGFKLPGAASVKSCGGERPWLKGVAL